MFPPHRARSRQSTSTTTSLSSATSPDSAVDSLHSWSMEAGRLGTGLGAGTDTGTGTAASTVAEWSDADEDDAATMLPSSEEGRHKWDMESAGGKQYTSTGINRTKAISGIRGKNSPIGERPLIELDSDPDTPGFGLGLAPPVSAAQQLTSTSTSIAPKPSEELRRLLRQMEDEVKSTTPVEPKEARSQSPIKKPSSLPSFPAGSSSQTRQSPPPPTSRQTPSHGGQGRRANWREGRRIGVYPPAGRSGTSGGDSSPERGAGGRKASGSGSGGGSGRLDNDQMEAEEEEEEESPPTPPMRITNPYLYSARKVSGQGQTKRISSRAAVLQNSISRSPPPADIDPTHVPTPLETSIATHPAPSDPSSSRSPQSFRSSPTSRKGKERASSSTLPASVSAPSTGTTPQSSQAISRRYTRHPSSSDDDDEHDGKRVSARQYHYTAASGSGSRSGSGKNAPQHPSPPKSSRPTRTPRRLSVDLAPETSALFAQEVEGLEVHGGVDYDYDESGEMGGRPWGSNTSDSAAEDEGEGEGEWDRDDLEEEWGARGQNEVSLDKTERTARATRFSPDKRNLTNVERSPNAGHTRESGRGQDDSSRLTRILQAERSSREETISSGSGDVSLPALLSPEKGDERSVESLGERRAGMFRSGSRSRSSLSPSVGAAIARAEGEGEGEGDDQQESAEMSRQGISSRYDTPDRSRFSEQSSSRSYARSNTSQNQNRSLPTTESRSQSQSQSYSSLLDPAAFPSPPTRVGITLTPPHSHPSVLQSAASPSTPEPRNTRSSTLTPSSRPVSGDVTTSATPHPPGWLAPMRSNPNRSVRFSPLRKTDKDWSMSVSDASATISKDGGEASVQVHRLRLSPAKSTSTPPRTRTRSPLSASTSDNLGAEDGDTSFTARLTKFLLPRPSTTLQDATADLERARTATQVAQRKVEESRLAWMEALGALGKGAGPVVLKSAGWGNWAWWLCVELLLLWGVFRVTLDYAAYLHPESNSFITRNLHSCLDSSGYTTTALSARIPAALSAFVVRRDSANFFDLMERYEVWRRIEAVLDGIQRGSVDGGGSGGVIGMGMRMVGGVPS